MRSTGLSTAPSLVPRALLHALLAAACLVPLAARADFDATVVTVSDGDSLRVRPTGDDRQVVIRLLGVDAPEICQAHGREAREALRAKVLGRVVRVHEKGPDAYQRLLAGITSHSTIQKATTSSHTTWPGSGLRRWFTVTVQAHQPPASARAMVAPICAGVSHSCITR